MIPISFNRDRVLSLRLVPPSSLPEGIGKTFEGRITSASTKAWSKPWKARTDIDGASGNTGRGKNGSLSGGGTSASAGGSSDSFSSGSTASTCGLCWIRRRFLGGLIDSGVPLFANSSSSWFVPVMISIWLSVRSIARDACVLCFLFSFFFFRYLCLALVFCYKIGNKIDMRSKLADTDFWRRDADTGAHLDFSGCAEIKKCRDLAWPPYAVRVFLVFPW